MADAPKILATDTLRQSYPKLNQAIDNSNAAWKVSSVARTESSAAIAKSDHAKLVAEGTQTQLNNIVIESGTSDAEVIQARGEAPVLNERLNGIDEKVAEVPYYDEITYETYRDEVTGTTYYITHVPHLDRSGNIIKIDHGYQHDLINSGNGETARNFSNRNGTSVALNASVWNVSNGLILGIQIKDSEILQDTTHQNNYTLGIKEDNVLVAYGPGITAQQILDDGCVNALTGFYPLIESGSPVNPNIYNAEANTVEYHPRQVIAQLANKDIIILTSLGRTKVDKGLTYADITRILQERGADFAYCLDGGGSTQTVVRGLMINHPIDGDGKIERKVMDFLYVKKPSLVPEKFKTVTKDIGEVNKKVSDLSVDVREKTDMLKGYIRLKGDSGVTYQGIEAWEGDVRYAKLNTRKDSLSYYDYIDSSSIFEVKDNGDISSKKGVLGTFLNIAGLVSNCNNLSESGFYWANSSTANTPSSDVSWGIIHFQVGSASAMQISYPFHNTLYGGKIRRTDGSGGWYPWRDM